MNVRARALRLSCSALLLAITTLLAAGCGDDGMGARYKVSGTVTYKGEKVKKATISFKPKVAEGHSASGEVVDGSYTLTTLTPGDGAFPGSYKVTVDDRQIDNQQVQAEAGELAKKRGVTYNAIPQELQIKASKKAKSTLPGKYQIEQTTDIEKEVKAESNTINIELKD